MDKNVCVVVPAHVAQKTKKLLKRLELWDGSRRLKNIPETGMVAIPIASKQNDPQNLLSVITQKSSSEEEIDFQIKEMDLPSAKKLLIKSPQTILIEGLTRLFEEDCSRLTDVLRSEVPDHWERHGDLVLLPDKAFTSDHWNQFGNRLWLTVCKSLHCRRLARKSVVSQDGFRSPQVTLLYGEDGWVEQIDNGIRYTYDVTRCMFSSGNITEKLRVAKFDCRGETVVDLYAGIGYFTLPYLLHTGVKHLHACEWNPDAMEALQRNLWLNGVEDKCTVHFGDNRKGCPENIADRVNLGLIPSSEPGWRTACAALKSSTGGILHIHGNVNTKTRHGERAVDDNSDRADETMSNATHSGSANSVIDDNVNSGTEHNEGAVGYKLDGAGRNTVIHFGNVNSVVDFSVKIKPKDNERALECISENISDAGNLTTVCKDKTEACYNPKREINVSVNSSDDCKLEAKNSVKYDHEVHKTRDNIESYVKMQSAHAKTVTNTEDNLKIQSLLNTEVGFSKWLPWAKEVLERIRNILRDVHVSDWRTEILHIEHVKSYAPHVDHVVLDLKCSPVL